MGKIGSIVINSPIVKDSNRLNPCRAMRGERMAHSFSSK
jgi:hypothetical protein